MGVVSEKSAPPGFTVQSTKKVPSATQKSVTQPVTVNPRRRLGS